MFLCTHTRSPNVHCTCKQPPSDICMPNYTCISLIYTHSWRAIKTLEPASHFPTATSVNPCRGGRAAHTGAKPWPGPPRLTPFDVPPQQGVGRAPALACAARGGLVPVPPPAMPSSGATLKPAIMFAVCSAPVLSDWRLSKKD